MKGKKEKEKPRKVVDISSSEASCLISGFSYYPDFVGKEEEEALLGDTGIYSRSSDVWTNMLQRRVVQYGFEYDYRKCYLDFNAPVKRMSEDLRLMGCRIKDSLSSSAQNTIIITSTSKNDNILFDQAIVNEYEIGQGITAHVDRRFFDDYVASVSLGSTCLMEFQKYDPYMWLPSRNSNYYDLQEQEEIDEDDDDDEEERIIYRVLLEPRSLMIIQGEARYEWMHGIPRNKIDTYFGISYPRERRVSITFRSVDRNYGSGKYYKSFRSCRNCRVFGHNSRTCPYITSNNNNIES